MKIKSNNLKVVLYSLGFFTLISIFNSIAAMYNMSTFHRMISILAISCSHLFFVPLFTILKNDFKK